VRNILAISLLLFPPIAHVRADDLPQYGIGGRCVAFAESAPEGLVVTPPEAPLPVEVYADGEWIGTVFACCGIDEELCRDLPSAALAARLAISGRDCARVNAEELADCLGVRVETPTNYQVFIRTR